MRPSVIHLDVVNWQWCPAGTWIQVQGVLSHVTVLNLNYDGLPLDEIDPDLDEIKHLIGQGWDDETRRLIGQGENMTGHAVG